MNNNSIPAFEQASLRELGEVFGITRMTTENDWNQTIGGLIFQGGLCTGGPVDFGVVLPKKVLGIFGPNAHPTFDLEGFTPTGSDVGRTFHWMAIGF